MTVITSMYKQLSTSIFDRLNLGLSFIQDNLRDEVCHGGFRAGTEEAGTAAGKAKTPTVVHEGAFQGVFVWKSKNNKTKGTLVDERGQGKQKP